MKKNVLLVLIFLTMCSSAWGEQPSSDCLKENPNPKSKKKKSCWENSKWFSFSYLKISETSYFSIYQKGEENFLEVPLKDGKGGKFKAILFPGLGVFYFPKDVVDCSAEVLEYYFLQGKYFLFFISKAFPEGPDALKGPLKRIEEGRPEDLVAGGGKLKMKSDWKAEVEVKKLGKKHFLFNVLEKSYPKPYTVEWNGNALAQALPDSEPLEGWLSCWWRSYSDNKTIESPDRFKTFGDLRAYATSMETGQ